MINDHQRLIIDFLSCILVLYSCLLACLLAWLVWAIGRTGRSGPWGSSWWGGGVFALFFDGPFVALAVWSPGVPVGGEMEDEREEDTGRRRKSGGSEGKI